MYNEKLVVCIKNNGKILREQDSIVHLPFSSEYQIYIKNLHTRKCKINVEIDSTLVIKGLLLNAGENINLERFVEGFSNSSGPRFKFIEKTQQISDFRGDKAEDGLIRVEYQFEKQKPVVNTIIERRVTEYKPYTPYYNNFWYGNVGLGAETTFSETSYGINTASYSACADNIKAINDTPVQQFSALRSASLDGITVHGSDSKQAFSYGSIGELEENKHVIILKLFGTTSNNEEVIKPITVETKIQCSTCGTKSNSYMKFCGNCGTRLI